MNKAELESILRRARAPEISGKSLEDFPSLVINRLKHNGPSHPISCHYASLAWAAAMAACLMVTLIIGYWRGPTKTENPVTEDILSSAKFVREMLAMFPNRVRAIVEDAQGVNLVLSEGENVPSLTPLYVHICAGQHCSSFVTFSGQEIQVAGQKMMALADGHGGFILTGDRFVWCSAERIDADSHLKIEVRNLTPAI